MQNPPGFGALCAIHPDRTARVTCRRCGNFMCDECSVGGSETMCPKCIALSGTSVFPYDRNNVTFGDLLNHVIALFQREWLMLSIAFIILMGIGMVSSILSNIIQSILGAFAGNSASAKLVVAGIGMVVGTGLSMVVQGVFQMGIFRMNFDVLQGRKADLARMFTQTGKLARYVVQTLIVFAAFAVPAILYFGITALIASKVGGVPLDPDAWGHADVQPAFFIIIGLAIFAAIPILIYFGLPLQFASMELVYGDCDALEGIRRAFTIANGFRLWIFGYGFIGSLAAMIGIMLCCLPGIAVLAALSLLNCALYMAARNGVGLPPPREN